MRDEEMTRLTVITVVPHGVVFVYDPNMIIDVPSDTSAGPVLSTPNCLGLWTIGEDDGEVELTITNDLGDLPGPPIFEGKLETGGKRLAFNDSGGSELVGVDVAKEVSNVKVFANDSRYPSKLTCIVD